MCFDTIFFLIVLFFYIKVFVIHCLLYCSSLYFLETLIFLLTEILTNESKHGPSEKPKDNETFCFLFDDVNKINIHSKVHVYFRGAALCRLLIWYSVFRFLKIWIVFELMVSPFYFLMYRVREVTKCRIFHIIFQALINNLT